MIIAKINNYEILDVDVQQEIACLIAHSPIQEITKEVKKRIIERIIDEHLLLEEANRCNIKIDQTEVEMSYIDNVMLFESEEDFNNFLKQMNMDIPAIKNRLYNKILIKKYITDLCKNTPGCSTEFINKFYSENKNYFLTEPQVSILNFVIPNSIKNSKSLISEIRNHIKTIEDFMKITKDLCSKNKNYHFSELGFISRGDMVKEFEDVAFSLNINQVSVPFKTILGQHIIAVIDKKEPCITKVNILQDSLAKRVKEIESELSIISHIKKLRENATIIIYEEFL
jgi:hypothetical protein